MPDLKLSGAATVAPKHKQKMGNEGKGTEDRVVWGREGEEERRKEQGEPEEAAFLSADIEIWSLAAELVGCRSRGVYLSADTAN